MNKDLTHYKELTDQLFRVEYGAIVSVIGRFLGLSNIHHAEDIAQETFYKAVTYWQHNGIPENPKAWLYKVAKNKCINLLKRKNLETKASKNMKHNAMLHDTDDTLSFSENSIKDDQLRLMYACCHKTISPKSQIALILKILCGFSISEIAKAFFSSSETINKRLTRARKKLKSHSFSTSNISIIEKDTSIVLKTIYLIFNEGYSPTTKDLVIRKDLCFQSIRLGELIIDNEKVTDKNNCHALLSLMYLNISRFEARNKGSEDLVEMKNQDRSQWNQDLIKMGLGHLDKTFKSDRVSKYHLLAAISANHCIATEYSSTDWTEILSLYDSLIVIDNSPLVRLNRSVAIAYAQNSHRAIEELKLLEEETDIENHHLFHSTIAEFYSNEKKYDLAIRHLNLAINKADNNRDVNVLRKKIRNIVPN